MDPRAASHLTRTRTGTAGTAHSASSELSVFGLACDPFLRSRILESHMPRAVGMLVRVRRVLTLRFTNSLSLSLAAIPGSLNLAHSRPMAL